MDSIFIPIKGSAGGPAQAGPQPLAPDDLTGGLFSVDAFLGDAAAEAESWRLLVPGPAPESRDSSSADAVALPDAPPPDALELLVAQWSGIDTTIGTEGAQGSRICADMPPETADSPDAAGDDRGHTQAGWVIAAQGVMTPDSAPAPSADATPRALPADVVARSGAIRMADPPEGLLDTPPLAESAPAADVTEVLDVLDDAAPKAGAAVRDSEELRRPVAAAQAAPIRPDFSVVKTVPMTEAGGTLAEAVADIPDSASRPMAMTTSPLGQTAAGLPPDGGQAPIRWAPAHARHLADAIVTARGDSVEVALAPEELGRVKILISGPREAQHVTLVFDRPEVADAARRNVAILEQDLSDLGMASAQLAFGDAQDRSDQQPAPDSEWTDSVRLEPQEMTPAIGHIARAQPMPGGRISVKM